MMELSEEQVRALATFRRTVKTAKRPYVQQLLAEKRELYCFATGSAQMAARLAMVALHGRLSELKAKARVAKKAKRAEEAERDKNSSATLSLARAENGAQTPGGEAEKSETSQ